jgi:DNA uptake protein ComE-like DNA-binding protein
MSHFRTPFAFAVAISLAACGGGEPETAEAPAAEQEPAAAVETAPQSTGLLNPNEADAEALLAVPGMTAELVDALIAARPFTNMLEVDAILAESLDEAAREEAYRSVFLPLDLNAASEAELLLIPGVGDRLAYEFDEYRPYEAIERFRAEIGKYVDEAEVARLEQYVEIR